MNKMKLMLALGAVCAVGVLVAAPGPGHAAPGGAPGVRAPGGQPHHGAKQAPRAVVKPAKPGKPGGVHHHGRPAPKPVHHVKHPAGARHWARPTVVPPRRHGALRAWEWVAAAWNMTVNGVYYYGDGYYYDGYNYYYNGAYYTTPPVVVTPAPVVVTQPAPVVTPAPVVVTPQPAPPPPPPRRRGFLEWLFGD